MGYVHETHASKFIPPSEIMKEGGVWTPTIAGDAVSEVRGAAAGNINIFIPVTLPGNSQVNKGTLVTSIDVHYTLGVADLTSVNDATLHRMTLPANPGDPVGGAVEPTTIDGAHDTSAKRKMTGNHRMTLVLLAPVWIGENDHIFLQIGAVAPAGTVFTLHGARVNYTMRV